jgi:hypothetical protein
LITILCSLTTAAYGQILTLRPSLSLSERYDDNIFQVSTNKEADFITIITPGMQLRYEPSSSTLLDFDYSVDFEFFAQNTEQNQIGQRGNLRFEAPLTRRLSIAVRDTLIITQEPGDRLLEIDEATGLRSISQESREQTVRNRATATLDLLLTARSTFTVLFDSLIEDVEDPTEVDEFRYTLGAELGYLLDVRRGSRLRLFYDVTFHTFSQNGPVAPGTEQPDFQVHTINVGYRHDFTPTLLADVFVGYAITASEIAAADGDTGLVANIGLTKTLRNGSIALRYRRNVTSGGGEGGSVVADIFTLAVSSNLSPKISVTFSTNLSMFDFQETGGEDRSFVTIRPNLAYQMLRFWALSFGYDFSMTNFESSGRADRIDHRLTFTSQFTIRESLFLGLTYRYRARQFGDGDPRGDSEFIRNEVVLTLTYAPTFLFGRQEP